MEKGAWAMIWWICGAIGYLVVGILVAASLFFIHDKDDELYSGIFAIIWPIALILLIIYGIGSIVQYIGEKIRKYR